MGFTYEEGEMNKYGNFRKKEMDIGSKSGSRKSSSSTWLMRRVVLGIGFWMQGMRCYPWMGVIFFLKDTLRLDPSTLQILQTSSTLPMVAKPFTGLLFDSFYICGHHRLPYIAVGAFLQVISWLAIASFSSSSISFFTITIYLFLGNLGALVVEVANYAIVAETRKQPSSSSKNLKVSPPDELHSFVWMASSIGGVLRNLLGGVYIERIYYKAMLFSYRVLLTLQFFLTIFVSKSSLKLPKNLINHRIKKKLPELLVVLNRPEIFRPIAWFAAFYATIPALRGTMLFYQTQHLKIDSSVLGTSKVFRKVVILLWGVMYNRHLKSIQPRKLISAIQAAMVLLMITDVLFMKGFYQTIGVADSLYVVVLSGHLEVLYFFKILPFSVLMAKLCPAGCEGSLMAFIMSTISFAFILSGYLGVALASYVGVTGDDFSGLPYGLLIQATTTL